MKRSRSDLTLKMTLDVGNVDFHGDVLMGEDKGCAFPAGEYEHGWGPSLVPESPGNVGRSILSS